MTDPSSNLSTHRETGLTSGLGTRSRVPDHNDLVSSNGGVGTRVEV